MTFWPERVSLWDPIMPKSLWGKRSILVNHENPYNPRENPYQVDFWLNLLRRFYVDFASYDVSSHSISKLSFSPFDNNAVPSALYSFYDSCFIVPEEMIGLPMFPRILFASQLWVDLEINVSPRVCKDFRRPPVFVWGSPIKNTADHLICSDTRPSNSPTTL